MTPTTIWWVLAGLAVVAQHQDRLVLYPLACAAAKMLMVR